MFGQKSDSSVVKDWLFCVSEGAPPGRCQNGILEKARILQVPPCNNQISFFSPPWKQAASPVFIMGYLQYDALPLVLLLLLLLLTAVCTPPLLQYLFPLGNVPPHYKPPLCLPLLTPSESAEGVTV
jgi:hypothetical protein